MKTRAAILRTSPGDWAVEEVELDEPQRGELLIRMVATGLCHSDEHQRLGDVHPGHLPMVGGHEGSGVVEALGPGVDDFEVGDHVVTSFIPACGKCKWCSRGQQNLCDLGRFLLDGVKLDGTYRMHTADGLDVAAMSMLGTFAEHQVIDQTSLVKIDQDLPLESACLVACGVQTGYGSAHAGDVQPGDVVIVAGVGGIGMNAVQGVRDRGAAHVIAVDPVADKQKWALDFGATETYSSIEESMDRVRHLTNGQGADVVILAASKTTNQIIGEGFQAIRKAGTLVVTGVSPQNEAAPVPGLNAFDLVMYQKRIQGAMFGMASPRDALPNLLNLYRVGKLKLDELVTKVYPLDQVNEAYADMHAGRNIRGVIGFQ